MSLLREVLSLYWTRKDFFLHLFVQHLQLSFFAVSVAALIGVIIAVLMCKNQTLNKVLTPIINILYTIPSIAVFGLLIPLMGIGFFNAWTTLVIYGVLPVTRNTLTGLQNVQKTTMEAAMLDGCGPMRILFLIEIPLSMPYILSSLRTMTVMVIALAGIAAFIGAGGLGVAVWRGITMNYTAMIVAGSILIAFLAVIVDLCFVYVQKFFHI